METRKDCPLFTTNVECPENNNPSVLISGDEMRKRLGITQEELDNIDDVEFE